MNVFWIVSCSLGNPGLFRVIGKNGIMKKRLLTCVIHAFSLMQMRGIGTCRHSVLFQASRNAGFLLRR